MMVRTWRVRWYSYLLLLSIRWYGYLLLPIGSWVSSSSDLFLSNTSKGVFSPRAPFDIVIWQRQNLSSWSSSSSLSPSDLYWITMVMMMEVTIMEYELCVKCTTMTNLCLYLWCHFLRSSRKWFENEYYPTTYVMHQSSFVVSDWQQQQQRRRWWQ